MNQAQGPAEFELDEDLFDFAGVAREPDSAASEADMEEVFAAFRDPAADDELLDVPAARSSAPAAKPVEAEEPPAPAVARVESASVPAPLPSRESASAPRVRATKGVVAIAIGITLLNSTLAVVMLRGRSGGLGAPHEPARPDEALAAPPGGPEPQPLPDPESRATEHSHPTLDEAREEIARGEHAAARRRVYGLLAIIDRLDDPRRSELEADCQFLIAQSLHLEALARMGGSE